MRNISKLNIIVLGILLLTVADVLAQQTPGYTQYTMNKYVINPAAAGMDGYTTIGFIAREQWVGFGETPKIHAVSIDSRILGDSYIMKRLNVRKKDEPKKTRSGNTAWGTYFYSDIFGPLSRTGISGTYAYHLEMGNGQLSFGFSLLMLQQKVKDDEFVFGDNTQVDPLTVGNTVFNTDANFGVYYTTPSFYAGYSTMQLFNSVAQFGDDGIADYTLHRQHNIIGGYRFGISETIDLEPSFLVKLTETSGSQFDINLKSTIDNKYWAGLNYRTGSAMSVFGGLAFDRYYFGYAFDYNFNTMMPQTYGTHEFMVLVRLGDSARRYRWLNSY